MRSVWMLLVIVAAVGLLVMPAMALEEVSDEERTPVKGQEPVKGDCLLQSGCPPSCGHTVWVCQFMSGSTTVCHEAKKIGYLKCVDTGSGTCWDTSDTCVCWVVYKDTVPPGTQSCRTLFGDRCVSVNQTGCPDNKCWDSDGNVPDCPQP